MDDISDEDKVSIVVVFTPVWVHVWRYEPALEDFIEYLRNYSYDECMLDVDTIFSYDSNIDIKLTPEFHAILSGLLSENYKPGTTGYIYTIRVTP